MGPRSRGCQWPRPRIAAGSSPGIMAAAVAQQFGAARSGASWEANARVRAAGSGVVRGTPTNGARRPGFANVPRLPVIPADQYQVIPTPDS